MHERATVLQRIVAPDPELLARLDTDETTRRILAAAIDQIAVVGWSRLTIHDVAKRSGVGRATVYRRFPGKEQLLDAVLLSELGAYLAGNAAARAQGTTPEDRLAATAAFAVEYLRGHPLLARMLETEPESLIPSLTAPAVIAFAREVVSGIWCHEIYGDRPISAEKEQHIKTVAELHVRLTLSLVTSQDSIIPLETAEQAEAFARRYLAPLLNA